MVTTTLKKRFQGFHWDKGHTAMLKLEHLLHEGQFWAIVALVAFLAILVTMAVIGIIYGEPGTGEITPRPFYPYGY